MPDLWPLLRQNIDHFVLDVSLDHDFIITGNRAATGKSCTKEFARLLPINICKRTNINLNLIYRNLTTSHSAVQHTLISSTLPCTTNKTNLHNSDNTELYVHWTVHNTKLMYTALYHTTTHFQSTTNYIPHYNKLLVHDNTRI